MFCPKCGAMLKLKKENGKTILSCTCGYSSESNVQLKEKIKKKEYDDIVVVDKDIEVNTKVKERCPECGHSEAYFWELQTRAPDESPTKFFKCVKCKHVWKDYD